MYFSRCHTKETLSICFEPSGASPGWDVADAKGKPLAGSLGDLRLLDAVTVVGKLTKDEHGNHVLLATGWHRDARPELPADLLAELIRRRAEPLPATGTRVSRNLRAARA